MPLLSVPSEELRLNSSRLNSSKDYKQEGRPVAWVKGGHTSAWACRRKLAVVVVIFCLSVWGVWALEPMHEINLRSCQVLELHYGGKGGFSGTWSLCVCVVAGLCLRLEGLLGKLAREKGIGTSLSPLLEYSKLNSKSPRNEEEHPGLGERGTELGNLLTCLVSAFLSTT